MIPVPGKWYKIRYGKKGKGRYYHGPAKCLKESKYDNGWVFRLPNQPENMHLFSYMLYRQQDIIKGCSAEPTYEELKNRVKLLEETIAGNDPLY